MGEVVNLDVDMEGVEAAVSVGQHQIDDIGPLRAKDAGHFTERPGHVAQYHHQPGRAAVRPVAPGKVEPIGIYTAGQHVAADNVHFDPLVLAAQADDPVAWDRVAAAGKIIGNAGG